MVWSGNSYPVWWPRRMVYKSGFGSRPRRHFGSRNGCATVSPKAAAQAAPPTSPGKAADESQCTPGLKIWNFPRPVFYILNLHFAFYSFLTASFYIRNEISELRSHEVERRRAVSSFFQWNIPVPVSPRNHYFLYLHPCAMCRYAEFYIWSCMTYTVYLNS